MVIEVADEFVLDWANGAAEGCDVVLELPDDSADPPARPVVSLHLLRLGAPRREHRPDALEYTVELAYLVTVSASDLAAAHGQLGRLLIAAEQHTELQVDCSPVPPEFWTALGLYPRPSFWLTLPGRARIEQPLVPLVRMPISVNTRAVGTTHGVIMGPDDQPVVGASIRFAHRARVRSDRRGRFSLSLPVVSKKELRAAGAASVLEVNARGQRFHVPLPDRLHSEADPFVIRFNPRES